MSRCFPFPPPGYEHKARPDDLHLIVKEKHKQKKHKDKKEKDKKERKEKERCEGKHKEDKDRKQKKHKDKKDKKKDKWKSSEDKNIVGPLDNQNDKKHGPDSRPSNGIQDHRILVELEKRVRDDGGATDNGMVQKVILGEQRKVFFLGKVAENSDGMLAEPCDNIKNKREHNWMANGQSLKFNANGFRNGLVGNFSRENQIKDGSCQVDEVEKRKDEKDKNEQGHCVGKGDGFKNEAEDKNRKAEDKKRKKEKKEERSKEKIKQRASDGNFLDLRDNNPLDILKESRSQGKLSKAKEPISNGFLHAKDNGIQPNNISRPALSSHRVSQNGSSFHPSQHIVNLTVEKGAVITDQKVNGKLSSSPSITKIVRNTGPGHAANNHTAEHGKATINNHVGSNGLVSNMVTMKPILNNGRADDKFTTSNPPVENGRKMARPNMDNAIARREPDAIHKIDNKEFRKNGLLECTKQTSSTSSASVKDKEKIGANMKPKPPHPDLKYLSQILTVPKVEWPQYDDDDQEWLFGCMDPQAKRPKFASSQIESVKPVWAEAMQVESAYVTALPYVIPY